MLSIEASYASEQKQWFVTQCMGCTRVHSRQKARSAKTEVMGDYSGSLRGQRTNVAREHEEVIVGQATVLLGVDERLCVDAIALRVLVLEYLERLGEIQSVGSGVGHGVAVGDGHDNWKKLL